MGALPETFDGWFIIEVDVQKAPSAVESSAIAHDWLRGHPYFSSSVA